MLHDCVGLDRAVAGTVNLAAVLPAEAGHVA
jgi:hypothetical protein